MHLQRQHHRPAHAHGFSGTDRSWGTLRPDGAADPEPVRPGPLREGSAPVLGLPQPRELSVERLGHELRQGQPRPGEGDHRIPAVLEQLGVKCKARLDGASSLG